MPPWLNIATPWLDPLVPWKSWTTSDGFEGFVTSQMRMPTEVESPPLVTRKCRLPTWRPLTYFVASALPIRPR